MGRGCLCLAYTYENPRIWAFDRHMEGTLAMIFKSNSTEFCAVSPDGKWIAARNSEDIYTIRVWDSLERAFLNTPSIFGLSLFHQIASRSSQPPAIRLSEFVLSIS